MTKVGGETDVHCANPKARTEGARGVACGPVLGGRQNPKAPVIHEPATSFLLKATNACNFACDHCYFRRHADQSYQRRPVNMAAEVVNAFAHQLGVYARARSLAQVEILFHGGEPLLREPEFYDAAVASIRGALPQACAPSFSMQSNCALLNAKWIDCLHRNQINYSVSLDGPRSAQDRHRQQAAGLSSYDLVRRNLDLLMGCEKGRDIFGGILAVVDLRNDPREVFSFFRDLGVSGVDYLWPDGNHDRPPPGIVDYRVDTRYAEWSEQVFDLWFAEGTGKPAIRFFENILVMLLGGQSDTEALGRGKLSLLTIQTDGEIQDTDVFSVAFENAARFGRGFNVRDSSLADLEASGEYRARARLHETPGCQLCEDCRWLEVCGGGSVAHRYGAAHDFVAPSIYCGNLMHLIEHIREIAAAEVERERAEGEGRGTTACGGRGGAVNRMNNVEGFLDSWDRPGRYPLPTPSGASREHVNIDGNVENPTAEIRTVRDAAFFLSIEAGVRRAVELLVLRLGLVTYSSCQGHELPNGSYRGRDVGILPRSPAEACWAAELLRGVASLANAMRRSMVSVVVEDGALDDGAQQRATLEISFRGPVSSWGEYVRELTGPYETFVFLLDHWTRLLPPEDLREDAPRLVRDQWDVFAAQVPSATSREYCFAPRLGSREQMEKLAQEVFCNQFTEPARWEDRGLVIRSRGSMYANESAQVTAQLRAGRVVMVQNHAWALMAWAHTLKTMRDKGSEPRFLITHLDCHTDMLRPAIAWNTAWGAFRDCFTDERVELGTLTALEAAIGSTAIGPGSFILPFLYEAPETRVHHVAPAEMVDELERVEDLPCASGRVKIDGPLPLGLGESGLALTAASAGPSRWSLTPLPNLPMPAVGELWILDIDCDYFDNRLNGNSDWRCRPGFSPPESRKLALLDELISWLRTRGIRPDLTTIAISPDFCPVATARSVVERLLPWLHEEPTIGS